jgi:hypothetical protein
VFVRDFYTSSYSNGALIRTAIWYKLELILELKYKI